MRDRFYFNPQGAPYEVRLLRFALALVLVYGALHTLDRLLHKPLLEENKLEVGLLLGFLIAKAGTVIDWLYGGSESGARRTDQALAKKAEDPQPVVVENTAKEPVPVMQPEPELSWPVRGGE